VHFEKIIVSFLINGHYKIYRYIKIKFLARNKILIEKKYIIEKSSIKNHMGSNHLIVESDAKNPNVDFETHTHNR